MVRTYRRKVGEGGKRQYDSSRMTAAVEDCKRKRESIRSAASKWGVPYSTLRDKVKDEHPGKYGGQTKLSSVEESMLMECLLMCCEWRLPQTARDVRNLVQRYLTTTNKVVKQFKNNKPGIDWFCSFVKRNPQLSIRMCSNIKRARAAVSRAVCNDFFDKLEVEIEGVPGSNIINYDETNFTDDPRGVKVVAKRGQRYVERVMDTSKSSTTVMMAVAADGTLLPPYTIYRSKYIYPTWIEGGVEGAAYNRNESGWMDLTTFQDWFKTIVMTYFKNLEGTKVMIGDNLSSHLSLEVIQLCKRHNIRFITLPPNATHLLQPLDVAFFGPLKKTWRTILEEWKTKNRGVIPKCEFPRLLSKTLEESGLKLNSNIVAGFTACGIMRKEGIKPCQRENVLKRLPREISETSNTNESEGTGEAWKTVILEQLMALRATDAPKPKRGKRMNVEAGRSVTVEDLLGINEEEQNQSEAEDEPQEIQDPSKSNKKKRRSSKKTNQENLTEAAKRNTQGTRTPLSDLQNQDTGMHFQEKDFVVCEFETNKNKRKFIGQIVNKFNNNDYEVMFMRRRGSRLETYFVFPNVPDVKTISRPQILHKIVGTDIRRGRITFDPVNIMGVE